MSASRIVIIGKILCICTESCIGKEQLSESEKCNHPPEQWPEIARKLAEHETPGVSPGDKHSER